MLAIACAGSLLINLPLAAQDVKVAAPATAELSASPPQDLSLTIYNQNFGLVRDVRTINLSSGVNFLRIGDVAAQIDPTSVSFESTTAPNQVVVREQNYQYDLIDPTTILRKSVGKTLKFRQYLQSGTVREITGTLLNSPEVTVATPEGGSGIHYQGLVIRTTDGIVLQPEGVIEIAELPPGLVATPSLLWKLETTKPGSHQTELRYQTSGMNWHADYVAVLNETDNALDLTSWVTLDNKSGATYENAALKLMAGDVHRVVQPPMGGMAADMAVAEGAPQPQFQEKSFAEYHLYTLQGKTTLRDKETKQMSLFNASNIPAKKTFVFDSQQNQVIPMYENGVGGGSTKSKVNVKIEVANTEANHLGMALPKGKVRVYKKDSDGSMQFIGEDLIDHTPRDEKIRLYIGDAFDVVGERKQMSQVRVSNHETRETYEISIRNHKKTPVSVTIIEHTWGDWKITQQSHPHVKKDARTFEFNVDVPANGEVKVTYTISLKT
jgi:hypothetical protein